MYFFFTKNQETRKKVLSNFGLENLRKFAEIVDFLYTQDNETLHHFLGLVNFDIFQIFYGEVNPGIQIPYGVEILYSVSTGNLNIELLC